MTAVALAYDDHGPADAPALVLGSSLGLTRSMWAPQVPAWRERLRVIAYDHRGHGASPVPPGPYAMDDLGTDVLALLDALELPRVSYCGLSLGGMVGMWLAIHAPERIDRLVVVCSSAHMPPPGAWAERVAAVRAAATVEVVADDTLARWLTPAFAAAHPAVRDELRAAVATTPAEGYAGCCEAIAAMDQRAELAAITAPTLVISGRDDPATPPEHGEAIAAAIPGARLELIDAAHLGNVEQPQAVAQLVLHHVDPDPEAQP